MSAKQKKSSKISKEKLSSNTSNKRKQSGWFQPGILLQQSFPKSVWKWAGGVIFAYFLLYLSTAPRVNVGYADSAEFLAVAQSLGVSHPPGYALYTLLLHFFINLPIPGTIAFRGHLLSILFHSITLGVTYLSLWRFVEYLQKNSKNSLQIISAKVDQYLLPLIGTIFLGSSFLFWLYGTITEKYAFNSLLISIFLLITTMLLTTKREQIVKWWWGAYAGVTALMLMHQQSTVFIIPVLLLVLWLLRNNIKKATFLYGIGTFLAVSVISILLLWVLNTTQAPVSWHFEKTLTGITEHILRQDFAGVDIFTGQKVNPYIYNVSLSDIPRKLSVYVSVLLEHFGWAAVIFLLVGIKMWYDTRNRVTLTIGLGLLLSAFLFPIYILGPKDNAALGLVMRHFLQGYVFLPFILTLGFWLLFNRLRKVLPLFNLSLKDTTYALGIISLLILSFQILMVYPKVNLRNFTLVSNFYTSTLKELPKDALLGCFTDISCFSLLYEQQVNHVRKDILIVPLVKDLVSETLLADPDLRGFIYTEQPFVMIDYLTWNVDKRPVFVMDMPFTFVNLLGLPYGFLYYVPHGYYGELRHDVPENLPTVDYSFSEELKDATFPKEDKLRLAFKEMIARIHDFNGTIYVRMGKRARTGQEINMSANLKFQVDHLSAEQIESERQMVESQYPVQNWAPGRESQEISEILPYIDEFIENEKYHFALGGALGVITIDPLNETGRMKLAEIYELTGDNSQALIEYKNVLLYHPSNEKAQQKVLEFETNSSQL